jgi:hypothetical protein
MNPWIAIWTKPRQTISHIIGQNPNRSLWALATIYGFCSLINMAQSMILGTAMNLWGILLLTLILAPFWGYINFSVWSWVVYLVGKCLKGSGRFVDVRAAYAWSSVPLAVNIPLWLLMVALFGHQLFLEPPDSHLLPNSLVILLFLILIVRMGLSVWSLVIYLNGLAEVQQFTILRAIVNVVLAGILLGIVMFILWNLFMLWKPI